MSLSPLDCLRYRERVGSLREPRFVLLILYRVSACAVASGGPARHDRDMGALREIAHETSRDDPEFLTTFTPIDWALALS